MSTPVLPLDYAAPPALLDSTVRRALGQMLLLSILSGLCVGVCFLSLMESVLAGLLHMGIFAATIVLAVAAGRSLMGVITTSGHGLRLTLDGLAGVGLVIIGLAPVGYYMALGLGGPGALSLSILGIAYALLAATTYRHLLLYRLLAQMCRGVNRGGIARSLIALGWCKMIYEALWLGCCATTLFMAAASQTSSLSASDDAIIFFALAALFGAMGFGAIWIWMIIAHAQLFQLTRPVS